MITMMKGTNILNRSTTNRYYTSFIGMVTTTMVLVNTVPLLHLVITDTHAYLFF